MKIIKNLPQEGAPPMVPTVKKKKVAKKPPKIMESKKLIQKQLVLLLHSHVCLKKDALILAKNPICKVPNCSMMQEVWRHIKVCKIGPDCPHQHCLSSRKILAHWKHCKDVLCPVCQLVRAKGAQQLELRARQQCPRGVGVQLLAHGNSDIPPNQTSKPIEAGQSTNQPYQGQLFTSQCQGHPQPGNESLFDSPCHSHNHNYYSGNPSNVMHFCDLNQNHHPNSNFSHYCNHQPNYAEAWRGFNTLNGIPQFYPQTIFSPSYAKPSTTPPTMNQYNLLTSSLVNGSNNSHNSEQDFTNCHHHDKMLETTKHYAYPVPETKTSLSSTPSANDVKRAYEQLGIPCPSDALRRLLATLPGGCPDEDVDVDHHVTSLLRNEKGRDLLRRPRGSVDTDDGIHDTISGVDFEEDETRASGWCSSIRGHENTPSPPNILVPSVTEVVIN